MPGRRRFDIGAAVTHIRFVFNELKGGDPMSSDFVTQRVAPADCLFGKQPS